MLFKFFVEGSPHMIICTEKCFRLYSGSILHLIQIIRMTTEMTKI